MSRNTFLLFQYFLCFFIVSGCNTEKSILSVQENWYTLLPDCPCRNPDFETVQTKDGWARELRKDEMSFFRRLAMKNRDFTYFHPGATATFRSYPPVKTIINKRKRKSGQQCAYDKDGKLITTGTAAGTPDKISPARKEGWKGELKVNILRTIKHLIYDAGPWQEDQWKVYHKFWPPSLGKDCD